MIYVGAVTFGGGVTGVIFVRGVVFVFSACGVIFVGGVIFVCGLIYFFPAPSHNLTSFLVIFFICGYNGAQIKC